MYLRKFINSKYLIPLIFLVITIIFFYKTFIYGYVPFPGDLLISEYSPWKYESYLGYNPGSYPNKAQYFDVIRQLYPWKELVIEQLKSGTIPFWNPYNFSGTPLLANSQSGVFYPVNLVFFIVPFSFAWSIYIILQTFLCLIFTYLYLRSIVRSKGASLFGSVSFSFSLFMTVFLEYGNINHTFIWLPLILFGIEKSVKKFSIAILLVPFGIFMSGTAGHLQIFSYVLVFSFAYLLFRLDYKKLNLKRNISLVLVGALGVFLTAIQLVPTMELINLSARVAHDTNSFLSNFLIQPKQLILFLSPDFFGNPVTRNFLTTDSYPGNALYIGISAGLIALFSLYQLKIKLVKFYIVAFFVVLLLVLRTSLTEYIYSFNIPFVSSSSPSNSLFLSAFCLTILSSFGFDFLVKNKSLKKYVVVFIIGLLFIFLWALKTLNLIEFSSNNFLLSTILLLTSSTVLVVAFFKKKIIYFLIVILVADLAFFFWRFNSFVPSDLVFPKTSFDDFQREGSQRSYVYGEGFIEPNFQTHQRTYSVEGYDPLYIKDYGIFLYSDRDQRDFDNVSRSNAIVDFRSPGFQEKTIDLLGIKYVYVREATGVDENVLPVEKYKEIESRNGWKGYENLSVLNRGYLVNRYENYSGDSDFAKKFYSPQLDLRETVLVEDTVSLDLDRDATGSVEIIDYKAHKVLMRTNTTGKMFLNLTDVFYPGWKVFVNGEEKTIVKSNLAFRGVEVGRGTSIVEFSYHPESFYLGLKITIMSLVLILVLFMINKYEIIKKK